MTTPLQAAAVQRTANPCSLLAHVSSVSSLKGGLDVLRRIQIPGAEMTTDSDLQGVSAVADTQEVSAINPVASTANPNGKHEARTCCPFHSIRLPAGVRTQSEGDVLSMADGIDA